MAKPLTLNEAINEAINKNLSLQIAYTNQNLAENNADQQVANLLPKIDLNIGRTQQQSFELLLQTTDNNTTASRLVAVNRAQYNINVAAEQNIVNPTAWLRFAAEAKNNQAAQYAYRKEVVLLTRDVCIAYYNWAQTIELYKLTNLQLNSSELLLKAINEKLETKAATYNQLLEAQLAKNQQQINLNNLQQQLQNYAANLAQLMQRPNLEQEQPETINNFIQLALSLESDTSSKNIQNIYTQTLLKRHDVQQQSKLIESLELYKKSYLAQLLPSINVRLSGGYLSDTKFSSSLQNRYWVIAINGSLNLFNGFLKTNQIREASIKNHQAKLNMEQLKQSIFNEVQLAHKKLCLALEANKITTQHFNTAYQYYKRAQTTFNSQAIDKASLLKAEQSFLQAQAQNTTTLFNLLQSYTQYLYSTAQL